MVQLEWVVLCDSTFRDDQGKSCMIGVFDRISAHTVPTRHPRIGVAIRLRGTPGRQVTVDLRLIRPDNSRIGLGSIYSTASRWGSIQINCNFHGIEFPLWGDYQFEVLAGEELMGSAKLTLINPADLQDPDTQEHSSRQGHGQ